MKRVLSFLLMIVFMHASVPAAFAKSGGPSLGSTLLIDVVGTYAGVLVPKDEEAFRSSNTIGLFSLSVPQAGSAIGNAVIFVEGASYTGRISGIVDPLDGKLTGIIDATATVAGARITTVDSDGNATTQESSKLIYAQGSVEAKVKETANFGGFPTAATVASFATTRIQGKAVIDIFSDVDDETGAPDVSDTIRYSVEGFRQSNTVIADLSTQANQ